MEINTSNQIQGPEAAPKASEVKREKEEASGHQVTRTEDNPDYRISLSKASKEGITESTRSQTAGQAAPKSDLAEEEAARLAQQASGQLAQTNASISNQAIQKAVDLFT
jgi:hypothetical protein